MININFLKNLKRPRVILLGLILLMALGGGFLLIKPKTSLINNKDYVFKIDSKEYSATEVNKLTAVPRGAGLSEDESAKLLYEYLINKAAAEKSGITFSEDQIKEAKLQLTPDKKDPGYDTWYELVVVNDLIKKATQTNNDNYGAQGYSFVFRFGDKIEKSNVPPTGFGDAKLIEADRDYAKQRADFYQSKIKDKSISPDDALKEIKADTRLGYLKSTTNFSTKFGYNNAQGDLVNQVFYKDVASEIQSLTQTGLGEVKVGKTNTGKNPEGEDLAETFYYFIQLNRPLIKDVKTKLETAKKELKTDFRGFK